MGVFLRNAWRPTAPDMQNWLDNYVRRRYGAKIPAAKQAWKILYDTVYSKPRVPGRISGQFRHLRAGLRWIPINPPAKRPPPSRITIPQSW